MKLKNPLPPDRDYRVNYKSNRFSLNLALCAADVEKRREPDWKCSKSPFEATVYTQVEVNFV